MRLLSVVFTHGPIGAAEIASLIGESVQRVRRHLNALVEQELVEVSEERRRRGVVKRYYVLRSRVSVDDDDEEKLSDRDRRRSTFATLRFIFEEASRAAANPRLAERRGRMVANVPGKVDERGWQELADLHHETLERTIRIVEESASRLADDDEPALGVISQQVLLEAPQHAPPDAA